MKKTPRVGKHMGLWHEHSRGDTVLHQAVNKSLDRTIEEVMGRTRFEHELHQFQKAQRYVQDICMNPNGDDDDDDEDLVVSMCDAAGHDNVKDPNRTLTCYIWSYGCDHQCLNERVPHPIPPAILSPGNS